MTDLRTFTVAEAAAVLHITPDWLRRRLCERKLPGRKLGRTWVLTEADLQAALDIHFSDATTPAPDPSGVSGRSRKALNRKGAS